MITREQAIENRIIRHRARLGYPDALVIRRAKLGRGGFGIVDVMLLPEKGGGSHRRLVLVEVKQRGSGDTAGKVVGQVLLYYAAAMQLGIDGLEHLRQFARNNERRARRASLKTLQMLTGLAHKADWRALKQGRKLRPREIALIVGLSEDPKESLRPMLRALKRHHQIDITVVIAHGRKDLKIWRAHK
jgi:hypothetical protein